MTTFEDLVTSRKAWLADILKPWCRQASLAALRQAELEWHDLAGRVAAEKTLWPWAWSRFPALVHESLGIEETTEVEVALHDGRTVRGFPDSRASQQGRLILWGPDSASASLRELGPYTLEEIASVKCLPE